MTGCMPCVRELSDILMSSVVKLCVRLACFCLLVAEFSVSSGEVHGRLYEEIGCICFLFMSDLSLICPHEQQLRDSFHLKS